MNAGLQKRQTAQKKSQTVRERTGPVSCKSWEDLIHEVHIITLLRFLIFYFSSYSTHYLPNGNRKREAVSIKSVDPAQINRQDAIKALSIRKAEMAQGKFDIAQTEKRVPFTKLGERFIEYSKANKKSYERDITSIKFLNNHFGNKSIQQILGM